MPSKTTPKHNPVVVKFMELVGRLRGITFPAELAEKVHQTICLSSHGAAFGDQKRHHRGSIDERILEELRENNRLLRHLFRSLTHHRVLGGVMSQVKATPMTPVAPGNTCIFAVTPLPAGVVTLAAQAAWTTSDPTNAPVTPVATDETGLTATVALAPDLAVGSEVVLTWTYTNADGTKAVVEGTFPVVAPPPPPPPPVTDVTGGTMSQIA